MDASESHDEPVHLEFEGRELYLIKVPPTLGEAWKKIDESDLELGSITLGKRDRTGRRKGTLTINNNAIDKDLPTNYKIDITPSGIKAKVFSQDGSGRMALEGVVENSGRVVPERSGKYSDLCKRRLLSSMIPTRVVQALETLPRPARNKVQLTIDKPQPVEDEEGVKSVDKYDKKLRMDKEEVKNLIFHHFEEKEFWPLKELNAHLHQPDSYLKEILKEICVYHKRGINKSCYELKPQYKDAMSVDNQTNG